MPCSYVWNVALFAQKHGFEFFVPFVVKNNTEASHDIIFWIDWRVRQRR